MTLYPDLPYLSISQVVRESIWNIIYIVFLLYFQFIFDYIEKIDKHFISQYIDLVWLQQRQRNIKPPKIRPIDINKYLYV